MLRCTSSSIRLRERKDAPSSVGWRLMSVSEDPGGSADNDMGILKEAPPRCVFGKGRDECVRCWRIPVFTAMFLQMLMLMGFRGEGWTLASGQNDSPSSGRLILPWRGLNLTPEAPKLLVRVTPHPRPRFSPKSNLFRPTPSTASHNIHNTAPCMERLATPLSTPMKMLNVPQLNAGTVETCRFRTNSGAA